MEPKAVPRAVQHELQQLLQDLLGIDGGAQSREEGLRSFGRYKGSCIFPSSRRTKDEEAEARASFASQGLDLHSECGRKKRKDAKGEVSAMRSPPIMQVLDSTKLSKLKGQQKHTPWRQHQSILCAPTRGRCQWGNVQVLLHQLQLVGNGFIEGQQPGIGRSALQPLASMYTFAAPITKVIICWPATSNTTTINTRMK